MSYPFVHARYDYGTRKGPVLGFTIHMAEGGNTVQYLANAPARGVSVHYVIEYSGRVIQMLLETHASGSLDPTKIRTTDDADGFYGITAARAVLGSWWRDPNSAVLSVEIEGFAANGPNQDQRDALIDLVADLRTRYPAIGLLGHRDHADYKACPGRLIPWDALGGHGPAEDDVTPLSITSEVAQEVQVPKGTPYLDLDGKTVLGPGPTADLDWRPSPFSIIPGLHAIYATVGGIRRVVLVKDVPARNVPVPPTQADIDAAVNVALDHVAVPAIATTTAIAEARPR